ncbi:MAG: hypothetical protein ACYC0V_20375 [Armatimonadota bacterium]
MTQVVLFSSPVFDKIADILVTETATMANVSLYLWFAKYIDYNLLNLKEFHRNLLGYIQSGNPTTYLTDLTRDFPSMFNWYGSDIVHSQNAVCLMGIISEEINSLDQIAPYDYVEKATSYLNSLHLTDFMETLTGCQWPTHTLRLVAAKSLFNQMYVYPNTIICRYDQQYAEFVAMIAHEGGHILSLDIVNSPELRKSSNQALVGNMAEALAHAVQMCVLDEFSIRYEDLFPGANIHSHDDYLKNGHPWLQENSCLVIRLVNSLRNRGAESLSDVYQHAFQSVERDFNMTVSIP